MNDNVPIFDNETQMNTTGAKPEQILSSEELFPRALALAGIIAVIAISFIPFYPIQGGPGLCGMKAVFGMPCPACGLTRSFISMAALRPIEAAGHNIFGPPLFVAALAAIPYLARELITRRRNERLQSLIFSKKTVYSIVGLLLVYQIYRMVHFAASGQFAAQRSLLRMALIRLGIMH